MSGADRYQEAYQHLAEHARTGNPDDLRAAQVQALLALAAATVLPLVVQHMGDTAAITDWARMVAPDVFEHAPARDAPKYEPAIDHHGEAPWLTHDNYVDWLPAGVNDEDAPEGWRRLYVEPATNGGEPA